MRRSGDKKTSKLPSTGRSGCARDHALLSPVEDHLPAFFVNHCQEKQNKTLALNNMQFLNFSRFHFDSIYECFKAVIVEILKLNLSISSPN